MELPKDIDFKKLERSYFEAVSELGSIHHVLDVLRAENEHLRHIIDMLIQSSNKNN